MNHSHEYAKPTVRSLGSVEEMTRQEGEFDKIGTSADTFTMQGIPITGCIVPDGQPGCP